jgi:hypothetical protein
VLSLVLTNVLVNFKFYRRNRLLVSASLFIIFVMCLSTLPAVIYFSKTKHLDIIITVFARLSNFATIVTAGLGLLLVSHHLSNRTVKMVFTKPCPPGVWLGSSLASALTVSLTLYSGIFIICSLMFAVWDVPYQWGILYVVLNDFLKTIILLSYISFLSVVFHPVIAVLFLIVFHESAFYFFKTLLYGGIKALGESSAVPFLKVLKGLVDLLYMVTPTFTPFSEETAKIYSSLRLSDAGLQYLLMTCAYALTSAAFFYLLAVYFLKKKRLI